MESALFVLAAICIISFMVGWSLYVASQSGPGLSTTESIVCGLSLSVAGITFFAFLILAIVAVLFLNHNGIP